MSPRTATAAVTGEIVDPIVKATTTPNSFGVDERFERVPLGQIASSSTNPRKHFDGQYLDALAGSILEKGVVQPILLRPLDVLKAVGRHPAAAAQNGAHFEIVAGECRYRAATLARLTHIPAIIRALTDEQVLELQLVENIHRRDLTPLEQARGYRALIDTNPTKHSAESIATRIGMSPQWVWDRLKLNDLVREAKLLLEADRMSVGHAILIARLTEEDQARAIAPGTQAAHGDKGRGGLWTEDYARFAELEDHDAKGPNRYAGLKPVSIRELQAWLDTHVRFDVAHAAQAMPLQFEPLAEKVAAAEAKPGRGKKVIAITFEHFTQPEARDESERTFGPSSWKFADGEKHTDGYPKRTYTAATCDYSVLGVVAAGEQRGASFDVCIARDKCQVHWKKEIAERAKTQKLYRTGKKIAADKREAAAVLRDRQESEKRQAREARWKVFKPALEKAVKAAVAKAPANLPKALFARVLTAFNLPSATKPARLQTAMLEGAVGTTFRNAWHGEEERMVAWAKLLKVDVKACEPKKGQATT